MALNSITLKNNIISAMDNLIANDSNNGANITKIDSYNALAREIKTHIMDNLFLDISYYATKLNTDPSYPDPLAGSYKVAVSSIDDLQGSILGNGVVDMKSLERNIIKCLQSVTFKKSTTNGKVNITEVKLPTISLSLDTSLTADEATGTNGREIATGKLANQIVNAIMSTSVSSVSGDGKTSSGYGPFKGVSLS